MLKQGFTTFFVRITWWAPTPTMCVIGQLFPFYCFSPISKELCPLSPCNLISRFPLISTSLFPGSLCLVVNIKGVKEHLPTPSPWKWVLHRSFCRAWICHLMLFFLLTSCVSSANVRTHFFICQFWICFLFQMKKNPLHVLLKWHFPLHHITQ